MIRFLWERYFLKEISKVFSLFLFSFYFLYVLIDYSTHMQDFIQKEAIQFHDFLLFYGYQFIKRASILCPLALLIATIKVLTTLNAKRELVALLSAGIPIRTLLRPFFVAGIACAAFLLVSNEFLLPKALNFTDEFHNKNFRNTEARQKNVRLKVWYLEDGSKLLYQKYDEERKAYFDVFWLRSADDIWRMKYLSDNPHHPSAEFVDHIERTKGGLLEKTNSYPSYVMHGLKWGQRMIRQGAIPVKNRSISSLTRLSIQEERSFSYKKSEVVTQILYKTSMPFLALLMPLAIAPFCIQFSRRMPTYLIYAASLFGYIVFYTLMDATVILGENQVVSPFLAIITPIALCFSWFSYRYSKKT